MHLKVAEGSHGAVGGVVAARGVVAEDVTEGRVQALLRCRESEMEKMGKKIWRRWARVHQSGWADHKRDSSPHSPRMKSKYDGELSSLLGWKIRWRFEGIQQDGLFDVAGRSHPVDKRFGELWRECGRI